MSRWEALIESNDMRFRRNLSETETLSLWSDRSRRGQHRRLNDRKRWTAKTASTATASMECKMKNGNDCEELRKNWVNNTPNLLMKSGIRGSGMTMAVERSALDDDCNLLRNPSPVVTEAASSVELDEITDGDVGHRIDSLTKYIDSVMAETRRRRAGPFLSPPIDKVFESLNIVLSYVIQRRIHKVHPTVTVSGFYTDDCCLRRTFCSVFFFLSDKGRNDDDDYERDDVFAVPSYSGSQMNISRETHLLVVDVLVRYLRMQTGLTLSNDGNSVVIVAESGGEKDDNNDFGVDLSSSLKKKRGHEGGNEHFKLSKKNDVCASISPSDDSQVKKNADFRIRGDRNRNVRPMNRNKATAICESNGEGSETVGSGETDIILEMHENHHCLTIDSDDVSLALIALSCVLRHLSGPSLPAESLTRSVISHTLFPLLSSFNDNHAILPMSLLVLTAALRSRILASAILSPLVIHIDDSGRESTVENPLRIQLFQILEGLLRKNKNVLCETVRCVRVAMDAIVTLERKKYATSKSLTTTLSSPRVSPNVGVMLRSIVPVLSGTETCDVEVKRQVLLLECLRLLRSIFLARPSVAAGFIDIFLLHRSPQSSLSLLDLVDMAKLENETITINALEALKEMLRNFCLAPVRYDTVTSIPSLCAYCICWLQSIQDSAMHNDHHYCQTRQNSSHILLDVSVLIVTAASLTNCDESWRILEEMARVFFFVENRQITDAVSQAFRELCGGTIREDGRVTAMSGPLITFLLHGYPKFMLKLAEVLEVQSQHRDLLIRTLHILGCIGRTLPCVIIDNQRLLIVLARYVGSKSAKIRLATHASIEQILFGRGNKKNDGDDQEKELEKNTVFMSFLCTKICTLLLEALEDTMGKIRQHALGSLGSLKLCDWYYLDRNKSFSVEKCLSAIIEKCIMKESSGEVRAVGCRTLGRIFTVIFNKHAIGEEASIHIQNQRIVEIVSRPLCKCLGDNSQAVRCMTLFAVGNLIQTTVSLSGANEVLAMPNLIDICVASFRCLEEKNEKIKSSAIRTMGHLIHGCNSVFRSKFCSQNDICSIQIKINKLTNETISILASNALAAVNLCDGNLPGLSWKLRSIINKHAWGSCYALSYIFQKKRHRGDIFWAEREETVVEAVEVMLRCVRSLGRINGKVAAAAVVALEALDQSMWLNLHGLDELKPIGLFTFVYVLSEVRGCLSV
uniref:Uncharacterized protein n=1 Tax=Corethron hystrix TaxID=216773 RepID=A0A7S1BU98_9STRA|mmetsp:Transcript_41294/g.96832  ORF Transcript_41294/g.96832 Transcript_41294/m.96832 type:complete len:1198 (+) Transcript_41294:87-3680(+)